METKLEAHELQKLRVMAAELGSHSVTITTEVLRAALLPVNREYVEGLIKETEAQARANHG